MAIPNFLKKTADWVVSNMWYYPITKSEASGFRSFAQNPNTYMSNVKTEGIKKPGRVTFKILRAIAKHDAVIRICVNTIRKSVSQCPYAIRVKKKAPKEKAYYEPLIQEVEDMFDEINMNWENMRLLLDRVLEDLLVLDAGVIEKVWSLDGTQITALNSVDGATVRPIYNEYWELWDPAYVQVIWGKEDKIYFMKEDIVYMMANPQNDIELFGYGLSPIESIMLQAQAALQADMYNIKNFTKDNIPPGMLDLWDISEEDAANFIALWNATVIGNTQAMKFVRWAGDKKFTQFKDSNRDMQYTEYLDWISRIKLAAFGLTSIDANITQDVNKATAQAQEEITNSKWVRNVKRLVEDYFNTNIIRALWDEYKRLEFKFEAPNNLWQEKTQAEIDKLYVEMWATDPISVAEMRGLERSPDAYIEESSNVVPWGDPDGEKTEVYTRPMY